MHNLLAAGWLIAAVLAFWLAYWAGEAASAWFRVGMALYALLLTLSLVVAARAWLNKRPDGGARTR